MSLPTQWNIGSSIFVKVQRGDKVYAVLQPFTVDDLDVTFLVKVDPASQKPYYTNLASRTKSWDLPDLAFRQRVERFYSAYAPERLSQVDRVVARYGSGEQEVCIAELVKKYGPEPSPVAAGSSAAAAATTTTAAGEPNGSAVPSPAQTQTYAARVQRFYEHYCPAKIAVAQRNLEKYKGQEEELIKALIEKYGPEPPLTATATAAAAVATVSSSPPPAPTATASSDEKVTPEQQPQKTAISSQERPSESGASAPPPAPPVPTSNPPQVQTPDAPRESASGAAAPEAPSTSGQQKYSNSSPVRVRPLYSASLPPNAGGRIGTPSSTTTPAVTGSGAGGTASLSVAMAEAENRERILTGFIQDREQRLQEAQQRYEATSAALEMLRKTNQDLESEMEQLRRDTDKQVNDVRIVLDRLREDTQVARNEWHREKQRLEAAVSDASVRSHQLLQTERLRMEEETVKFIGEKTLMQQELHAARQELDVQSRRASDLLSMLDKQDLEHQRLLRQIEDLHRKIDGAVRIPASTQTDTDISGIAMSSAGGAASPHAEFTKLEPSPIPSQAATFTPSSPPALPSLSITRTLGAGGVGRSVSSSQQRGVHSPPATNGGGVPARSAESTVAAIEEFDRIMTTERFRRQELDSWKQRCAELERELDELHARDPFEKVAVQSPCDCATKLRTLKATIGALRSGNRALENKIAELELRLVAQPPLATQQAAASPHGIAGDADHHEITKLREVVLVLKEQLAESREASKDQRREIQEMRARLATLMSSPTYAARRAR